MATPQDALLDPIRSEVNTALQDVIDKKSAAFALSYKTLGLQYIKRCEELSTTNGVLDVPGLKAKLLAAINLLQSYHDSYV